MKVSTGRKHTTRRTLLVVLVTTLSFVLLSVGALAATAHANATDDGDNEPVSIDRIRESNPQFFTALIVVVTISIMLIAGAIWFFIITHRRNKQRKVMAEAAQAASRAKSNFLANMSHEMRTPLTTVLGLTELTIEKAQVDDETLSNLIKIYRAGETLLGLVNDVLDISKIEAGKFILNEREYELPDLINDTISQCAIYISEKPIKFTLNIENDLPNYLYGDDLRIRQILNNLLSNAYRYTMKGSIELGIRCKRDTENEENIWMTAWVRDTGVGIREEDMSKLLTMYAVLEEDNIGNVSDVERCTEGSGLGLSITKQIAEMMQGSVSVESEYGKGSTFTVKIQQKYVNDAIIGKEVDVIRQLIEDIEAAMNTGVKDSKPSKETPDKELLRKFYNACESYDIDEMDTVMAEIESYEYTDDKGLVAWLRDSLDQGQYKAIRERLSS